MPTTSNFGWTTPADTDLVKDGAAAIRTLGNGIDTSLVDLKGGTTGQILSKASNTDLDYTWIANDQGDITEVQAGTGISVASGTGPVPVVTNTVATTFDAKGDLVAGTGADTFAKLTVGANDTVLTADSSTSTGLKWATPAAGWSPNLVLLNTPSGTTLTGAATVTVNVSSYDYYLIEITGASSANTSAEFQIRLNGQTSGYLVNSFYTTGGSSWGGQSNPTDGITFARQDTTDSSNTYRLIMGILGGKTTGYKSIDFTGGGNGSASRFNWGNASFTNSAAITSISVFSSSGNLDAGTIKIYGG